MGYDTKETTNNEGLKRTMVRIVEVPEKLEAFLESCEYCELSPERVLAEEQVEDGMVGALLALPVRVRHGDLIQICN